MVFINIADLLGVKSHLLFHMDVPEDDIICKWKPDGLVLVLKELSLHLKDLLLVKLLHVVAHFVTLLQTVLLLVPHDKVQVLPKRPVVELDLLGGMLKVKGGLKPDYDGFADTPLALDAGLDHLEALEQVLRLRTLGEALRELVVVQHPNVVKRNVHVL
jgi:hypothetical protein